MWSNKCYLKRSISCEARLLNELLETDMTWDDVIVVSAGELRKLWDSPSELRSSLCERRLDRTVLRPALLPVKTAQFTQFFHQVWRHKVKLLSVLESYWATYFSVLVNDGIVPQQFTKTSLSIPSNKQNTEIVSCHSGLNKFYNWSIVFKTRSIRTSTSYFVDQLD